MAETEPRKRYRDRLGYHAAVKASRTGDTPEPEFDMVETVDINTINGPRRVYADTVDRYAHVIIDDTDGGDA